MSRLIPMEVLLGNPERFSPQISHDGTQVAFIAPVDDVMNIWVGDLASRDFKPITNASDQGITNCFWSRDADWILYLQDNQGDENTHLFAHGVSTDEARDLTPFGDVRVELLGSGLNNCGDEILVAINKDDPMLHDVFEIQISTGDYKLVERNPGNVSSPAPTRSGWVADADRNVRACTVTLPNSDIEVMFRESADGDWRKLRHWDLEDSRSSFIQGFDQAGALYIVDSHESNAGRLMRMDPSSGAFEDFEVLVEDPQYDVTTVFTDLATRVPIAASIFKARREWSIIDPQLKEDFALVAGIQGGDFEVVSRDGTDRKWIVLFSSDVASATYYVFDRDTGKADHLFETRPQLKNFSLSPTEPISFTSRDGLTIHGYLTLPRDAEPKNLPLVLTPHGGPWGRDAWGFNPVSQWLADRGYACLQVNFRGSTGYGKEFLNAGNREWGGRMHDDLVDGVQWAVDQGIADSKRLACFGASYGGYASLVAATFTPDLFRCIIAVCGFANLITSLQNPPPYWKLRSNQWSLRVGNPETEPEFLWSRSPLSKVDQIRVPILIVQGANDVRVPQSEAEQVVAAMRERGLPYEYLLFPDEGHGFTKQHNRLAFYGRAEQFLADHL